ncbi:MAG: HPF/RaiA family ribosome-associated protein [Gemmatimonadales bacterium]|nr:HPF/RaiA family ribosome-associated protein [Gemmatimonadales bacterium]
MELPIQIATRNITLAFSEEEAIRREAMKLENFADRITSCRVMVEMPHRRGNEGVQYLVRIDLTLPGREVVVKRQPQEQLRTALQDAFDVAKRQIQDYVRRRRGFVKTHLLEDRARVLTLFPWEGYGFLEDHHGREIYFHKNSVLNGAFDRLTEGAEVRFVEVEGDEGPQASTVTLVR